MNFNDIFNNVVATLITSLIIAIFSIVFKFVKNRFNKNRALFIIKFKFYLCLLALISCSYSLFSSSRNLYIIPFIIDLLAIILTFREAIQYNDDKGKQIWNY